MIPVLHPEGVQPQTKPPGAMSEVLGQRSLLGVGVLLAWLVLFHLLVNIWLLCVFTSLLVVLGGWLGSQAVLESDSVVHLERFIKLEQVNVQIAIGYFLLQDTFSLALILLLLFFRFLPLWRMSIIWIMKSTTQ